MVYQWKMDSTSNLKIYTREIGHGATRAAIAMGKLFFEDSWHEHVFYNGDVTGGNPDSFARNAHHLISTNELVTSAYNIPAFFNLVRSIPDAKMLRGWAEAVKQDNSPVILCHESLAHALSIVGSTQPRFLCTLNQKLKPGELKVEGLDGIIVRSEGAKQELLKNGFPDDKIYIGTLVDPDIVYNLHSDVLRRVARLNLCEFMEKSQDMAWLTGAFIPPYLEIPADVSQLNPQHQGRFTVALITSGSGHYPNQIREVVQSFREPLSKQLVNLVLIGGCKYKDSPMNVANKEAKRLHLNPKVKDEYHPDVEGLQIVYNEDTKSLVNSSMQLLRTADVALLTSATDMLGATAAAACPTFVGNYRGLHEQADREYSIDRQSAINWFRNEDRNWTGTWDRIFERAARNLHMIEPTLYQISNTLYCTNSMALEINSGIRLFIEDRIRRH